MIKNDVHNARSSVISVKGKRSRNEDTYVLILNFLNQPDWLFGAVFDGHGGTKTAKYAANYLPEIYGKYYMKSLKPILAFEKAFQEIDDLTKKLKDGATAACFFLKKNQLTVANVGDSRVVLIDTDRIYFISPIHRLSNGRELRRVIMAGAQIHGIYVGFSNGRCLMITRSIGSHNFRKIGIISKPSITKKTLQKKNRFLLVATDGLWDSLDLEKIKEIILKENTIRKALKNIIKEAKPKDDLTAIVVKLHITNTK